MDILGVITGFVIIVILNSKNINMTLSLLAGALTTGLISGLNIFRLFFILTGALTDSMTIRLMVIIAIISGLGRLLQKNGSLDKMMGYLSGIVKNGRILSLLVPALIGTLSVPGGAILSAPIVDKSGNQIKLDKTRKTAINIFGFHIGLLVYPLYTPTIVASELAGIGKMDIIKYNFLVMLVGLTLAYIGFFRSHNPLIKPELNREKSNYNIKDFFNGIMPILVILILSLVLHIPFHFSVFAGLLIGAAQNIAADNIFKEYTARIIDFFKVSVNYPLVSIIIGIMFFKSVIEASGAINSITDLFISHDLPLSLMIVIIGVITGYLTGFNIASIGILIPLFVPIIKAEPVNYIHYISLLFIASYCGYLLSPVHLCLVLTKEFFKSSFFPIYKYLLIPVLAMLTVSLLQLGVFNLLK